LVKLAFWDTVNGAYRYVFAHPLMIVRTGWVYLLLNGVNFSLRAVPHRPWSLSVLAVVVSVLVCAASIAWHIALLRAILLGEQSWPAALQFRRRHWRIIGVTLLLMVVVVPAAAVAIGIAVVASHIGGPLAIVVDALIGLAALVAMDLGPRIYLMAPAIAIDDPAKAIRAAWLRGRRNTQRLFFGSLLMILPVMIVVAIAGGLVGVLLFAAQGVTPAEWFAQLGPAGHAALGFAQAAVQIVISAFGITFSALAYKQLAQNWRPPPALAAALLDT